MPKFIKLTSTNKEIESLYVNPNAIQSFGACKGLTHIDVPGDSFPVKETPEQILALINGTIDNEKTMD